MTKRRRLFPTSSWARVRHNPSTLCSSVCWRRCRPELCCWLAWIQASLALRRCVQDPPLPLNTCQLDTGRRRSDSPPHASLTPPLCAAYHQFWMLVPPAAGCQAGLRQQSSRLTELRWASVWSPWGGCWWAGWREEPPAAGHKHRVKEERGRWGEKQKIPSEFPQSNAEETWNQIWKPKSERWREIMLPKWNNGILITRSNAEKCISVYFQPNDYL